MKRTQIKTAAITLSLTALMLAVSWLFFRSTPARVDRWFRRHYPELNHGRLEKLLRTGQVRVDGKRARAGDAVAPGQAIRVPPLAEPSIRSATPPPVRRVRPEDEGLLRGLVLYRDASAIVINKPAGLAVQGGTNTGRHVDGLLDTLRFDSAERPRLVHRLDKDTSGVLLIARNAAAAAFFTRAFREKTTRKIYWTAVVAWGVSSVLSDQLPARSTAQAAKS
jgi:23S rRNA pseudouridine955/2504/2580 synthase